MKAEIELPDLPEGFEYTGEYRRMELGDYFYVNTIGVVKCNHRSKGEIVHIVAQVKTDLELMQERLDRLYEAALEGIHHVGAAYSAHRKEKALDRVHKIYRGESERC